MHLMSNFEVHWAETAKDPLPLAKNRKLTQMACVADKPPAIIISTQTRISKKFSQCVVWSPCHKELRAVLRAKSGPSKY